MIKPVQGFEVQSIVSVRACADFYEYNFWDIRRRVPENSKKNKKKYVVCYEVIISSFDVEICRSSFVEQKQYACGDVRQL